MLKERVPAELADRLEVLNRMKRAGLYTGSGCSPAMKRWVKKRDDYRCQFSEYKFADGGFMWVQCDRTEPPELEGLELKKLRYSRSWQNEIHHITPQSEMLTHPKKYGGEQPSNLINLCSGLPGGTGHHDLMSPIMLAAKGSYRTDSTAYEQWLTHIRESEEAGMPVHNRSWDGMMRMIAKKRTQMFLRNGAEPFPYKAEKVARS